MSSSMFVINAGIQTIVDDWISVIVTDVMKHKDYDKKDYK